jgi:epoxide hydrolase-like protein
LTARPGGPRGTEGPLRQAALLAPVRWAAKELVADRSQGVPLATLRELARFWAADYDWPRCEAKLNALPQFMTGIDG